LEIVIFRTLQKNDVKLEVRKSQKTRSDSKTDSKVRLKVRNAGPYLWKNKNRGNMNVSKSEKASLKMWQKLKKCDKSLKSVAKEE